MDGKILVAHASKSGATREIAEKIGAVLRESGLQADVLPVDQVRGLGQYGAVILGCAVYVGSWPKEALAFLQNHEQSLAARPVWLFSSGPTGEGDPLALLDGWRMPANAQPVVERIQPREVTVFHGSINPDSLHAIQKWVLKAMKKPMGDFRDWNAITAWAEGIAETLKEAEPAR